MTAPGFFCTSARARVLNFGRQILLSIFCPRQADRARDVSSSTSRNQPKRPRTFARRTMPMKPALTMTLRSFRETIAQLTLCLCGALCFAQTPPAFTAAHRLHGEARNLARFGVYTLTLRSAHVHANPYRDGANVTVTFTGTSGRALGRVFVAQGFWDGGQTYRARFSPPAEGAWRWQSASTDSGLHAQSGAFVCKGELPATHVSRRGPVREARTYPYTFAHEDGTPFFLLGDTQWSFSTSALAWPEEFQTYIDARSAQGFNYVHGVLYQIWPPGNSANEGGLPFHAHNVDRLNPGFWQAFDQRVAYMNEKGMVAGLLLAWANDAWKYFSTEEQTQRFVQYLINRYAAYNVFWIVAGEYEEAAPPGGHAAIGEYLRGHDPYQHPRTIHTINTSAKEFGEAAWHTTIYQQIFHARQVTPDRRFNKPVINSEFGYEGDQSAEEVRQDAWEILLRGGFAVYGDTNTFHASAVMSPENLASPGARFMSILKKFWTNNGTHDFNWQRFDRHEQLGPRRFLAGKRGLEYLVYSDTLGAFTVDLGELNGNVFGRWFDTRSGQWAASFGARASATFQLTPPDSGYVAYLAPRADSTPPSLAALQARALNATSALVSWQTDEPAVAYVTYGFTSAYGATQEHEGFHLKHGVVLTGLQPDTSYHLRAFAVDSTGNVASSADFVFSTRRAAGDTFALEKTVLFDSLKGRTRGERTGGRFAREGGWQVIDNDNMIVYDLGRYVTRGSFEVEVRNFDLAAQNFFTRHHLMSMFRNPWGNHHPIENTETVWDLHAGFAYRPGLKMLSWTFDQNERNTNAVLPWDKERTYRFKVVWQGRHMQFFIDDSLLVTHEQPREMELRYLFLGRDRTLSGDLITGFKHNQYPALGGPIFSNAHVQELLLPSDLIAALLDTVTIANVYANAARLAWTLSAPAVCYLEYGATSAYGERTRVLGWPAKNFSAALTNLQPAQTYHFRLAAVDAKRDTIYSLDQTFTTLRDGVYLFKPEADTFVEQAGVSAATRDYANFGFMSLIASAGREGYLRFQLEGLQQARGANDDSALAENGAALLRLHGRQSGTSGVIVRALEEAWEENEVTWRSKPQRLGKTFGAITRVTAGVWHEVRLDSLLASNGAINLALIGGGQSAVAFDSRESENAQPELIVFTRGQSANAAALADAGADSRRSFALRQHPNPFRETTRFEIVLPEAGRAVLKIYDLQGREVFSFFNEKKSPGRFTLTWNGLSQTRQELAAGIYFAVLRYDRGHGSAPQTLTQRILYLK